METRQATSEDRKTGGEDSGLLSRDEFELSIENSRTTPGSAPELRLAGNLGLRLGSGPHRGGVKAGPRAERVAEQTAPFLALVDARPTSSSAQRTPLFKEDSGEGGPSEL